jgi:adenylylsulfate kinase
MSEDHLFPEHHRHLPRSAKEQLLAQKGRVVWLYGLSGSGKSTLAGMLEKALHADGRLTALLDGDTVRTGLNSGLGFTPDDRRENIRRVSEVAKLLVHSGLVTICSFICPFRSLRELARDIIGKGDFLEVYVHATLKTCEARDPKGLYRMAGTGKIAHFTGRSSVFEPPDEPFDGLRLDTESDSPEASLDRLLRVVRPWVRLPKRAKT